MKKKLKNKSISGIDPKHIGLPNICFSLTSVDDKREAEFTKQRLVRGFDDSETWSLRDTISNFIIPRLARFREITIAYPPDLTPEKWDEILGKIQKSFEMVAEDRFEWTDDDTTSYEEGMKLFNEYFMNLWW